MTFLLFNHPDTPWSPPSLLINGHREASLVVKRSGRETEYSPPPSAEVKNKRNYTSVTPICLYGVHSDNIIFNVKVP